MIIKVTKNAIKEINNIFKKHDNKEQALRLKVIGGGCSGLSYDMNFDDIKENDNILEFKKFKIVIDLKSSIYLKGITLDYQKGLQGKGFVFKNPNATNTCGCGESFAI